MPSTTQSRRRFLAALGGGAAAFAGCLDAGDAADHGDSDGRTDWPQPHFDADGGSYNPTDAGPTSNPTTRWTAEIGWPTGRPVVRHDAVYVPTAGGLVARAVDTGEVRWRAAGDWVPAPATSNEGVFVAVGDPQAGIAALARDGSERWRIRTDDRLRAPPVYVSQGEGRLFVGDDAGVVYAVDPETGEVAWRYRVFGGVSSLAARVQTVVVGTTAGEVYALFDSSDHARPLWRRKLPGKVTAIAADDGGDAYVGTFSGAVTHLRSGAHAGATDWFREKAASTHDSVVLTSDLVVGTDGAGMHALDRHEGATAWSAEGDFFCAPAAAGKTAYVGGDGRVVAFALDGGFGVEGLRIGARRWSFPTNGAVGPGVTVADGAVFAPTHPGEDNPATLYALESG